MQQEPTFTARGNWGILVCDSVYGTVLEYRRENSCWEKPGDGYDTITCLDVDEWYTAYPGESISAGHDILDFGSWANDGTGYCGPELDWRRRDV